ncbi:MAG: hypothetical protein M5U28_02460 [Sandaracinaceae bacterium]|nr:hypothetical protein [Sandaracinaceae bacterium]
MAPGRRWGSLALLLLASACDGGHELAVDLRTDLVPGQEFDAVRVTLGDEPAPPVTASTGDDFASPRRVAELSGVAAGHHFVEVQLLRRGRWSWAAASRCGSRGA